MFTKLDFESHNYINYIQRGYLEKYQCASWISSQNGGVDISFYSWGTKFDIVIIYIIIKTQGKWHKSY